jgi:long-subunit fatty acid transport protein
MNTAIKIWITGLAMTAGLGTAGAQLQDPTAEGRLIRGPYFDAAHRLMFSQHDLTLGTSRSAAMGGAFTSLGADLSSMNINPAGLGMYQSSDWGFTTALSIDGMNTSAAAMPIQNIAAGGNRTSFGLNNIGAAYNVFDGSGALTSLTLGLSYNRAANFNSHTSIDTFNENSTIGEMFARQLNFMIADDLPASALSPDSRPFENIDILLHEWGAVLGLHTDVAGLADDGFYGWYTDAIPSNHCFGSTTRGGIYEYNFALGANLMNMFYLGATLGVTDITYSEDLLYEETYGAGSALGQMWWDQSTHLAGTGYTAKLGVIARPVEALRIGVAFHLPTWYTLTKDYRGSMGTNQFSANTGVLHDNISFNTAPKMLAGISGVIASKAIVALDWEVAWYNKIKLREGSTDESQGLYKPANTFRAGLEYLLTDRLSLRAGGAYVMDFMRNPNPLTNNPTMKSGYSITGGLGFNIGRNGYLDVAYVYSKARMTDYDLWFYDEDGEGGFFTGQFDTVGGSDIPRSYTPSRNRHMITLTLGNRF